MMSHVINNDDFHEGYETGFIAVFGRLIDREDLEWIPPDGIKDINDSAFFDRLMADVIEPEFLYYNDLRRRGIIASLEYAEGLEFEEVSGRWDSMIPPFDLNEDQWVEFIRNVRKRLEEIMVDS